MAKGTDKEEKPRVEGETPAQPELTPAELEKRRKKKKALVLGGGVLGLVATGAISALMAVPGAVVIPDYQGPFVAALTATEGEDIQVNLSGSDYKRYLAMVLVCEYDAYDEAYFAARVADEHFARSIKDALIDLAGSKTAAYLMNPATHRVFLEEVRAAVEPLLFPPHIGETERPTDADQESGLRGGLSQFRSTFRGPLHEHALVVDAAARTIAIDGGPVIEFEGTEEDLAVHSADGKVVFVDVTRLDPGFAGEVRLGVQGRVRRVLKQKFLVQ